MRSRFPKVLILLIGIATAALAGDAPHRCTASARECEIQIRQMMAGRRYLGVEIVELKPGLVIKSIVPDSPAERSELKAGDRLVAVNGHRMNDATARQFKQILGDASNTGTLWVIVQRNGVYQKIDVRLEPYSKAQLDKIIQQHLQKYHTAVAEKP